MVRKRSVMSERGEELPISTIGELIKIMEESKGIISLGPGEPDFDSPRNVVSVACKRLKEGYTHYSPPGGRSELKEAVVKKLKKDNFDSIIETKLEPADSVVIKQRIKSSFGLVPFEKPSAIPKDHTWEQLYLEGLGENIEVFELSWSQKSYTGDSHHKKWRVFLDKTTHLPQKIEHYEKLEGLMDDYELVETKEVSYLDDAKMKLLINVHF